MIRLFAALAGPWEPALLRGAAQPGRRGARWRPPETLHVTLRFFGEVGERVAEDLDSALAAARPGGAFPLAIRGAGAFGEGERPRAVWAGVETSEPLARLAGKGETAARRVGLKAEGRRFRPHVTLAYLGREVAPAAAGAWTAAQSLLRAPPFPVEAFGLYSSVSTPEGSRYHLERRYPLG